jgi:predicted nucleic acid-binding protein
VIVLDASVLIAHLDDRDAHHERAVDVLSRSGPEPLGASTITLAETLVAPARAGRLADAEAALDRLGVVAVGLGENAASRLAQLRAETSRKLPDCCVLLAARQHSAQLASFDRDLLAAAEALGLDTVA